MPPVCFFYLFPHLRQHLPDDDSKLIYLYDAYDYLGPLDHLEFHERIQERAIIILHSLPTSQYFEHPTVLETKSVKFLNDLRRS